MTYSMKINLIGFKKHNKNDRINVSLSVFMCPGVSWGILGCPGVIRLTLSKRPLTVRRITENYTFTENHRKPLGKSYL